jgi:putative NIF3 family GTP cyclohydrolase 1 type 2
VKLKKIYEIAIEKGIENDPRGKFEVSKQLKQLKKKYDSLSDKQKQDFDSESLTNPYSDTRILHGAGNEDVKCVLVGIDIDAGEMVLADRLIQKGKKIDLVISHHPEGRALAGLYRVMNMQSDIMHLQGVPINVAESLMQERISEIERRLLPANHTKTQDAARLLDIPLICLHTPADNQVVWFLNRLFKKEKPETLIQILEILRGIPEYQQAIKNNTGPKIVNGSEDSRAGKIFVDMTGGTEGAKDIFKNLANAGVGTIVGMHLSEEHLKKAKQEHINVIIAGHISSDNIGLNLILDTIEKQQKLDVLCCSGFVRVKRK